MYLIIKNRPEMPEIVGSSGSGVVKAAHEFI